MHVVAAELRKVLRTSRLPRDLPEVLQYFAERSRTCVGPHSRSARKLRHAVALYVMFNVRHFRYRYGATPTLLRFCSRVLSRVLRILFEYLGLRGSSTVGRNWSRVPVIVAALARRGYVTVIEVRNPRTRRAIYVVTEGVLG